MDAMIAWHTMNLYIETQNNGHYKIVARIKIKYMKTNGRQENILDHTKNCVLYMVCWQNYFPFNRNSFENVLSDATNGLSGDCYPYACSNNTHTPTHTHKWTQNNLWSDWNETKWSLMCILIENFINMHALMGFVCMCFTIWNLWNMADH